MEAATYCSKCKKRTPDTKAKLERKKRCFYLRSACMVCCGGKSKRVPKDRVKALKQEESSFSATSATEVFKNVEIYNELMKQIIPDFIPVNDEPKDMILNELADLTDSPGQE